MKRSSLAQLLFDDSWGYQTTRLLGGAAYVFIGPLFLLGWPPDFAHRWWTLIPVCFLGVGLFFTWRRLKTRRSDRRLTRAGPATVAEVFGCRRLFGSESQGMGVLAPRRQISEPSPRGRRIGHGLGSQGVGGRYQIRPQASPPRAL